MKHMTGFDITITGLALALLCCLTSRGAQDGLRLVPLPKTIKLAKGALFLDSGSRIVAVDRALEPLAGVLAEEILAVTGVRLKTHTGKAGEADVLLQFDPGLKGEAYVLEVTDRVVVKAGNYHALASGTVTLLQLLERDKAGLSLPRLTIEDEPDYPYRGVLIDLARKYHSPGGIRQVIELCRLYKIRYLQLHLTDDQLFMFPSTAFPQLGKGNWEFSRFEPKSKDRIEPYTLEELKELERFSQERGVHLVPEVDLPGHSGRLVGDAPETFAFPGNGSTVNIANPNTVAAVGTLLNEVMDVFQGTPYIHLGADEVGLGGLQNTPEYKQALQQLQNVKSPHDLYCKFISDLRDVVAARGKKMIAWEEAWNTGGPYPLPKDVLVMVWSHGRDPETIVQSGYSVVNATWTPFYIVRDNKRAPEFIHRWSLPEFGWEGRTNSTTLQHADRLAGAQLCSWENSEAIEIQSMRDRLALVGEKAWNTGAGGTFEGFKARLSHTDAILEKLVHPVSIGVKGAFTGNENTFTEPITVNLTTDRKGLAIKYTLDNSLPNERWMHYTGPFKVEQTVHLRAGLFDAAGRQQGPLSGSWFKRVVVVKPNLATGKPVTVGPAPDRTDSWSAKVAVDGRADDPNGHWASSGEAPQWLQIDLREIYPVGLVNVLTYYDGSRYYQLNVELSADGKNWKKVLDFEGDTAPATAGGYAGTFPETHARYVRVNMLKNSANPYVHIVEVIVERAE